MSAQYNCRNCGAKIQGEDTYCSKYGKKLSDVGKAIKLELSETVNLSDNKELSQALSSSFTIVSSDMITTGSLIQAIPKEKRKEIGINEKTLEEIKKIQDQLQALQKQPFIDLHGAVINAPVYVAGEDNNIVLSLNIEDSFNKLLLEIKNSDIDNKTKALAKSKAEELKAEITKQNPNVSKVRRLYSEVKSLAPFAVAVVQLGIIVGKILLGGI